MQIKKTLSVSLLTLLASGACFACSSSSSDKKGGTGTGGAGNDGGGSGGQTSSEAGGCDVTLAPSSDDQKTVQSALDGTVKSGNTVCFSPGTYTFTNHISLSGATGVTFRGTGAKREDVVLDFTGQTSGSEGVLVETDDFTIENLWIKNTQGNGIKVQANRSTFRGIKVSWEQTAGSSTQLSGAYAIYPTFCDHTLIEDNEVYGASDAGIYAGQCKHVIARNNNSHDNVLGLEVENTIGAEVYGNDLHDNSTGMALDLLQNLSQTTASDYLVHDNDIHANNLANFAEKHNGQVDAGNTALITIAPQGTGVLILAPKNVEFKSNKLRDNGGAAIVIASQDTADIIVLAQNGTPQPNDPATSRWPESIHIHDNTFSNNGTDPQGIFALVDPSDGGKQFNPYDIQWDGVVKPPSTNDADAHICFGTTNLPTFVNFHTPDGLVAAFSGDHSKWTTDTTAHQCTLPAVPPLTP